MRNEFATLLLKHARKDKKIILLTADLGLGVWNQFRDELPKQFYNVGSSEQTMLDIAVGLAYSGYKPFVYSITPFLLFRPAETIRTYINHENLNVKLIGSGRGYDYSRDGFSHYSGDDYDFIKLFGNITSRWSWNKEEITHILDEAIKSERPYYINLTR